MTERYLLDTNAVSATRIPGKNPHAAAFLLGLDPSQLFLSVIVLGELRRGLVIKRRRHGDASALERWIGQIEQDYADRTFSIDLPVAKTWGMLTADRSRPGADTLIAATALVHGLTVVTRNEKDYEDLPVKLLNPWQA
jgi:predicted nucleic acid-binding protein